MSKQDEIWRDVVGFEGYYQVSNLGRIRSVSRSTVVHSIKRNNNIVRDESWFRPGRVLKPICCGRYSDSIPGYVHLYKDGERINGCIKRLVAQAFLADYTEDVSTHAIRLKDKSKGHRADNLYIKSL